MTKGGFYAPSAANIFGVQCYGILAIIGWTAVTTAAFLYVTKLLGILRVSDEAEEMGLDNWYHKEEPEEFQARDLGLAKIMGCK